ncbi:MAG: peptidase S8 [Anaerolineae bacterium]|nr:peptidase S8 [Anaerolineae bacterium]
MPRSVASARSLLIPAAVGLLLTVLFITARLPGAAQAQDNGATANEYFLHYDPGVPFANVQAAVSASGGTIIDSIPEISVVVVLIPTRLTASMLSAQDAVILLEPNLQRQLTLTPDDEHRALQWGFTNTNTYAAWDVTTGSPDIVIAVLDSGVDLNHPDLDDHLLPGYDFVGDDTTPQDTNGHGTHVAGIANAETNNSLGVAGVAWDARTLPVQVSTGSTVLSSDVVQGIIYAANNNADIINLSLSGPGFLKAERDAVNYAAARGLIIVGAAGNHSSGTAEYPASYDHVISVASTGDDDSQSWFSNTGPFVDIAAPGSGIYSTLYNNTYGYKDGTSMASPFVAGVAALVLSAGHAATPADVTEAILCSADDLGDPGRDDDFGWGLVQTDQAVSYIPGTSPCLPIVEHDDFEDARLIDGDGYADTVDITAATSWDDDPLPCAGNGSRSVWYRYTPGTGGTLTLDTVGSAYDTVLGIYSGARGSLVELDCNNDTTGQTSQVTASVFTGSTYYVVVWSFGFEGTGNMGSLTLNAAFEPFPTPGCYPSSSDPSIVICAAE